MRRLAPFFLAIVILLLPMAAPAAGATGSDLTYQTANGNRTLVQMGDELKSVGYGGPWDTQSVISSYAQTTGGQVLALGVIGDPVPGFPQTSAAPFQGHGPGVLEVGGIGTDAGGTTRAFSDLNAKVTSRSNLSASSIQALSYGSCGSTADAENALGSALRSLRDHATFSQVAVVGHSRGGLIAFQTLVDQPDIASFVSAVVTVDSPFLGITDAQVFGYDYRGACEPAISELQARNANEDAWATWNLQGTQALLSQGVRVRSIANHSDCVYNLSACHGFWGSFVTDMSGSQNLVAPGAVQHVYDIRSSQGVRASHYASLHDGGVLNDIADVIAGR